MNPKFEKIIDPILQRVYLKQRQLEARSSSLDWYSGFLAHLQRSDSRDLRDSLRDVLAQHVTWYTRDFDDPLETLSEDLSLKVDDLEGKGFTYFQFPNHVVETLLKSLAPLRIRSIDNTDELIVGEDWSGANYKHYARPLNGHSSNLMSFPELVKIAANRQILQVVKSYLGALPRVAAAEVTLNRAEGRGMVASSDWHCDKGALSFLKMFIYLNDVTAGSGPHGYIAGSHDTRLVKDAVFKRFPRDADPGRGLVNTSRWSDEDANLVYPDSQVRHTGPAGLAILEDTRGFHRAIHPRAGYRLMITIEWSLDLATTGARSVQLPYEELSEGIRPSTKIEQQRFRYIFSDFVTRGSDGERDSA
jgi:hypothetical protein